MDGEGLRGWGHVLGGPTRSSTPYPEDPGLAEHEPWLPGAQQRQLCFPGGVFRAVGPSRRQARGSCFPGQSHSWGSTDPGTARYTGEGRGRHEARGSGWWVTWTGLPEDEEGMLE